MAKMNSFVKQFVAAVKGDDVEVMAQKAWRSAESALKTQIAAREGDTITFEDEVEQATEKVNVAIINNGKPISNREDYIDSLIDAQNALAEAQDELDTHLTELNFLKDIYKRLKEEAV